MTDGLTGTQTKILTWVIYALMTILSIATAYLIVEQAKMSEKYVRLERYQADTKRIEDSACRLEEKLENFANRVDDKLDVLILRAKE